METTSYHLSHTRRTFLLKSRRGLEISLAAILTPLFSFADETQQAGVQVIPLSARQEVLAKQLEGKLIAPCCFSQTVADHYSGAAAHMKQQIRQLWCRLILPNKSWLFHTMRSSGTWEQ